MRSNGVQGLHSVSDLFKQIHILDTTTRECVCEWIKSTEVRTINDLFAQVAFFRADDHKVTWEAIAILFQLPQSMLHRWRCRRETEM
jgi:hypothetical protein